MATTNIDDQDASIKYTGKWTKGGMNKEYQSTVTYSNTAGDSFVVPFTGTSIAVYATIDSLSRGVVTSYSIDGGDAVPVTTGTVGDDTYGQKLWESPQLASGKHKLEVTMVKVNTVAGQATEGTVWFDRFAVSNTPGTSSSSDSTTATTGGTTATSTKSSTAKGNPSKTVSTAGATQTIDDSAAATGNSSTNTGAIVAGVIVALLFVLALIAGFLWWRKRRARQMGGNSDSFEKFFNNPPHVGEAAQNRPSVPPTSPHSAYPFAGASVAGGAGAMAAAGAVPGHHGAGNGVAVAHGPPPGQPGFHIMAAPAQPGYNPNGHVLAAPPPPPSSFNPYGQHSSRPSLDSSSVTSSSVLPPSQQYFYAHNNENVLAYNAPPFPIATTANTSTSGKAPLPPASSGSSSTTPVPDPDSVAELKKRQQEAVANYNAGLSEGAGTQYIQHQDSGIRQAVELPPVYSAN